MVAEVWTADENLLLESEMFRNFLLQQPTLVNAWNAVFPTVIVNIFGIVIFLRMGWIVVGHCLNMQFFGYSFLK